MNKKFWINLFLILAGVVFGTMVAHLTGGVPGLSWLAFGQSFGLSSPLTLDLGVITLTFGINITISVATVTCTAIMLVIGRFIVRR